MFDTDGFVCRGTCAGGWPTSLVVGFVAADLTMLVVYSVLVTLAFAVYLRSRHVKSLSKVFLGLALVFFWCGLSHGVSVLMFWWPGYWFSMSVHATSAVISIGACGLLYWMMPTVLKMPRAGREADLHEELVLLRGRLSRRDADYAVKVIEAVIADLKQRS